MLWILLVLASLVVVGFAAYRPQFRRWAEPILSVLVAVGLISAFVVWWNDDNASPPAPASPAAATRPSATLAENQVRLTDLSFVRGNPASAYLVTGTVHNDGTAFLDYFTLDVTLEDCPASGCVAIGRDDALVIARIAPGQSAALRTSLVFPEPRSGPPLSPRWTASVRLIQASPAGP